MTGHHGVGQDQDGDKVDQQSSQVQNTDSHETTFVRYKNEARSMI